MHILTLCINMYYARAMHGLIKKIYVKFKTILIISKPHDKTP